MPVERRLAVRDGAAEREVLLVGTVTVGRSPSCEVSSPDPRLSRTHAAFEVVGADVVVRDLESRNGTRVNGAPIKEHILVVSDTVEVGPFTLRLVEIASVPAAAAPAAGGNSDATVLLPARAPGARAPNPQPAASPATQPPGDTSAPTRRQLRGSVPVAPSPPGPVAEPEAPSAPSAPPAPPVASFATAATVATAATSPWPASPARPAPVPARATPATAPRQAASAELAFSRATLLWVLPVALFSFLSALVPELLRPDERTPLLRAHYGALAIGAVELVRASREPAVPLDSVTTALRRHAGVVSARILEADGRVLAPMNEAGTRLTVTPPTGSEPRIVDTASGIVDLQVPASTGDGRAVVVTLSVDPAGIHPAPTGSIVGTVLLLACLGAAWLVAHRLTQVTDARLSRLGEEVELMTTRQVTVGRDPFGLRGGQRILDAVTFALSPAGRRSGDEPVAAPRQGQAAAATGGALTTATLTADAGFRILAADAGCEPLLGLSPGTAAGLHLIDALHDQAVADEVLRLVTLATPERAAQGSAAPAAGGLRLSIDVTRGTGPAPLTIRFTRV